MNKGYRRELDGLRAVAVLAVVIFHAELEVFGRIVFPGGFLGVDVFFVISGYLITRILLAETDTTKAAILHFYERRARRILPAFFVMVAACIPFALWLMSPEQIENFAKSAMASAAFISNIFFYYDTGYFSEAVHYKPLIHTWSLGVEEQFYLFYPLALWLLLRMKWPVLWVAIICTMLSLIAAEYFVQTRTTAAFYLLPTRAWELGAGVILALLERGRAGDSAHGPGAQLAQVIGATAVLGSFLLLDRTAAHPGLITVPVVCGTMALMWFASPQSAITRLLSWTWIGFVGLVSYSFYLWHQPVFAFYRLYSINDLSQSERVSMVLVSFGLAVLSWRFVESPVRRNASKRLIWGIAGTGTVAVLLFGLFGIQNQGWPQRVPQMVRQLALVDVGYTNLAGQDCLKKNCRVGSPMHEPSIALVGDSHAAMLSRSFDTALAEEGRSMVVLAGGLFFVDRHPAFVDEKWKNILAEQQEIILDDEIDYVILSARYTEGINRQPFDNGEGGVEALWPDAEPFRSPDQQSQLAKAAARGIQLLLDAGKHVILVYPVPEVGWHVPNTLTKLALRGGGPLTTSEDRYLERNEMILAAFDGLGEQPTLVRVFPQALFCGGETPGRCRTHDDTSAYYHDDDHLSVYGSDMMVREILHKISDKWQIQARDITSPFNSP